MKKACIFAAAVLALAIGQSTYAARDRNIPVVAKYVCSDLCAPNETIYVYEGIADPGECEAIGGEMYSHQGWELKVVCKVMKKKRCKEYDGVMGEFHFPFQPKNYVHLGCAEDMEPKDCRKKLRENAAASGGPNKWFMNNIGCLAH
jgi:hypothetical protein